MFVLVTFFDPLHFYSASKDNSIVLNQVFVFMAVVTGENFTFKMRIAIKATKPHKEQKDSCSK